jgi:hypothetical protein
MKSQLPQNDSEEPDESIPRDPDDAIESWLRFFPKILKSLQQKTVGKCVPSTKAHRRSPRREIRSVDIEKLKESRRNINHEFHQRYPPSWGGQCLWILGVAIHFCGGTHVLSNFAKPLLNNSLHEYRKCIHKTQYSRRSDRCVFGTS